MWLFPNVWDGVSTHTKKQWCFMDCFTVSLHSHNGRQLPAVKAVQGDCQWPLENDKNLHIPHEPLIHYNWGNHNLYLHQPITKGQCLPYCHQTRTVYQSRCWGNWANCCLGDQPGRPIGSTLPHTDGSLIDCMHEILLYLGELLNKNQTHMHGN